MNKWITKTPIITTVLLEYANVGQLWRMWTEHSALGQNVWSWLSVHLALWLWWNYYRVMLPNDKYARRATEVGIMLNAAVVLTVAYFRYPSLDGDLKIVLIGMFEIVEGLCILAAYACVYDWVRKHIRYVR